VTTRLASLLQAEGRLSRLYTGNPAGAEGLTTLPVVNLKASRALQAVPRFLQALRGDPAEVFLLTLGYINLAPLVRLRRPRARIVLRIGNTITPELRTLSPLARFRYLSSMHLAICCADAVIVQCQHMGEDLAEHFPGVGPKLRVVYNFIEDELWTRPVPPSRPLAEPYLFCAASMKPQKGFDTLFAAYARSARRNSAHLVVAGVDPQNKELARLMRENGLTGGEVIPLGFIPEPYDWIAHSELCVLASRFEGFSNFLLECAALGKPIVATNCPGGNAELFEYYPNAEAVPVDDIQKLAEAMEAPRRDLNREQARKYLHPFTQDHIYGRYREIITGQA
jgi:glycosyltransferase involved in cell wall biosynthesis